MAKFRLGGEIKDNKYWKKEEERLCRVCEKQTETWEHVWEECDKWRAEGGWQKMVGVVLEDEGESESRLRKLEEWRNKKREKKGKNGEKGEREG